MTASALLSDSAARLKKSNPQAFHLLVKCCQEMNPIPKWVAVEALTHGIPVCPNSGRVCRPCDKEILARMDSGHTPVPDVDWACYMLSWFFNSSRPDMQNVIVQLQKALDDPANPESVVFDALASRYLFTVGLVDAHGIPYGPTLDFFINEEEYAKAENLAPPKPAKHLQSPSRRTEWFSTIWARRAIARR